MKTEGSTDAIPDHDTATDANVESTLCDAPLGTKEVPRFYSPCRVHIHHTRNRLADHDGVSGKAVLDGIVQAGILADDSAKQVTSVSSSQAKGKVEMTTITITSEEER